MPIEAPPPPGRATLPPLGKPVDPYAPPQTLARDQPGLSLEVPDRVPLALAATVSTVLCCGCAPIGVVSLVYAHSARTALQLGQVEVAAHNADLAYKWALAAFGAAAVGALGIAAYAVLSVVAAMAGG